MIISFYGGGIVLINLEFCQESSSESETSDFRKSAFLVFGTSYILLNVTIFLMYSS